MQKPIFDKFYTNYIDPIIRSITNRNPVIIDSNFDKDKLYRKYQDLRDSIHNEMKDSDK